MTDADAVTLRPVEPADLPGVFDMQSDAEANRMAGTIPRTREAFDAHWAKVLTDPAVVPRVIVVGGRAVGLVSCFPRDGQIHVGYWIDRPHWGRGIASRALELLLRQVPVRPLVATAAADNVASLRVLRKCGFVVQSVSRCPADERHAEREVAVLVLA